MEFHKIVFVDTEVEYKSKKVLDIGAVTGDGREFHSDSLSGFAAFINDCKYICGHNILTAENCNITHDDTDYGMPSLITMQLSHKEVNLGYFRFRRKEIDRLMSGQALTVTEKGCFNGDKQILKFSASFCSQMKELKEKGYAPVKAVIRHIVYWQGQDMEDETKIILPNIEMQKPVSSGNRS